MYLQLSSFDDTLTDMAENKIAVSYIRWSSGRQRLGDSKARQVLKTREYCAKHGLTLDMQLVDDGKTAFKGKHIQKGGALGRFLEKLENNELPRNLILIVESLDRLSRQTVTEAMTQFLLILNYGVEIVTLVDGLRYSKKSLGDKPEPLLMSMVYMMRAHDESAHKAIRLGQFWQRKRQRAIEERTPMTSVCPGWLRYDKDRNAFVPIPDRVKKVRLIYWLWIRGWSRQKIARLFNQNSVQHWGKKQRKTDGWHHSYIDKILHTRTVLGEFVPHSTKDPKDDRALAGPRKPAAGPIKGYYPAVIPDAWFNRAQSRCSGPKGPIGHKCANIFQGLLKDGEYPEYTMYYRDHNPTTKWQYMVSDHRRVNPKTKIFSWNYGELEKLILQYITDLDWSTLTSSKSHEIKLLRERLEETEGKLKVLNKDAAGVIALANIAKDIPELAAKLKVIEAQRAEIRRTTAELRGQIKAREDFVAADGKELIRQLIGKNTIDARYRLRNAIRTNIKSIHLFRQAPTDMVPKNLKDRQADRMRRNRAVKLTFSNDAVRWITVKEERTARIDGKMPTLPEIVQDDMGGVVQDMRQNIKLKPFKKDAQTKASPEKKGQLFTEKQPKILTRAILEKVAEKTKLK